MFDISELPVFDLRAQQPTLDYVVATFRRQLARNGVEWRRLHGLAGDGLPYAVATALDLGIETWRAICHLCKESGDDPPSVRLAAAVPPLARGIAELVYWQVYLFDNPATNCRSFERAIWAKTHDAHVALSRRYEHNTEWRGWLRRHRDHRDWLERRARITPAERGQSRKVAKEWPTPSKMLDILQGRRRAVLRFLDDWYYGILSQHLHFTGDGFMRHLAHLQFMNDDGLARKYRSDLVMTSYVLYLSLLSELALDVTRVGHPIALLRGLWINVGQIFGSAQEFWTEQYESVFAQRRCII